MSAPTAKPFLATTTFPPTCHVAIPNAGYAPCGIDAPHARNVGTGSIHVCAEHAAMLDRATTPTPRARLIAALDALPPSATAEREELCLALEAIDAEEADGDPWRSGAEDWLAACRGAEAAGA